MSGSLSRLRQSVRSGVDTPAFWAFFDQGLVSVGNFATGVLLARLLTLAEFGQFSLIMAIVYMIHHFVGYLITAPMMNYYGLKSFSRRQYAHSLFALNIVLSLIAAAATALSTLLIFSERGQDTHFLVLIFGLTFLFFLLHAIHDNGRRQALISRRPRLAIASDLPRYLGAPLAFLAAIGLSYEAGLPFALLVLSILSLVAAAIVTFGLGIAKRPSRGLTLMFGRKHWRFGRWFLLAVIISSVSDQLLLIASGVWLGDIAISGWRAALYITGILNPLTLAFENFVPSQAAHRYRDGGVASLSRFLLAQFFRYFAVFVLVCALITLFSSEIMLMVFGPDYLGFSTTLMLAAASFVLIVPKIFLQYFFRASLQIRFILFANIGGAIATLVMLFFSHDTLAAFQIAGITGQIASLLALCIFARSIMRTSQVGVTR